MTSPENKIHRKLFIPKTIGWVSYYQLDVEEWYLKTLNLGYIY